MVKKVVKKTVTETTDDDNTKKIVAKEHVSKVVSRRKKQHKPVNTNNKRMTSKEREELLIQNFVGLQHAMTNMSIKFGMLSDNMSKLLSVFEEAAKGFVVGDKGDDKDMLNKIDSLLDQNKTIAKGLVLMEERVRTRVQNTEEAKKITEESNRISPIIRNDSKRTSSPVARYNLEKASSLDNRSNLEKTHPSMQGNNVKPPSSPYISSRPKPLPRI